VSLKCALVHTVKKHDFCFMQLCVQARDAVHKMANCSLFRVGTKLCLNLMALGERNWQSNRDNYIMRRVVICALMDDHVKDDEIGGVHSAHVTREKIPLERPKHTWEDNIKMNLNQCVRVWTELSLLKWDQSRRLVRLVLAV